MKGTVMTWMKTFLAVFLLTGGLFVGCSKDAPTAPNYGDPALVVEGTEVWLAIGWGGKQQFDRVDANGDGQVALDEFTVTMR